MALYPEKCTVSVPAKGLAIGDTDIVGKWGTAAADQGYIVKGTDDSEIAGKIVVVDKNLDYCTLEYAGVLRLPVADGVTLDKTSLGKKVIGGANATAKLADAPGALDPATAGAPTDAELLAYNGDLIEYFKTAKGRVIAYSNTTGDKYVDVAGFFG